MAFSETLKLSVKRKAHFRCCLCHNLLVEVHHIVPQEEQGPDTEDNAAPLCPSCHETYGANPQRRKFIRETRELWYEICATRYASDQGRLERIEELAAQAASKQDVTELARFLKQMQTSLEAKLATASPTERGNHEILLKAALKLASDSIALRAWEEFEQALRNYGMTAHFLQKTYGFDLEVFDEIFSLAADCQPEPEELWAKVVYYQSKQLLAIVGLGAMLDVLGSLGPHAIAASESGTSPQDWIRQMTDEIKAWANEGRMSKKVKAIMQRLEDDYQRGLTAND